MLHHALTRLNVLELCWYLSIAKYQNVKTRSSCCQNAVKSCKISVGDQLCMNKENEVNISIKVWPR